MFKQHLALSLVFSLVLLVPGICPTQPATAQTSPAPESNGRSMLFIENAGQWADVARFQVWGSPLGAGTTWLAEDAIWLVVGGGEQESRGMSDEYVFSPSPSRPLTPPPQTALKLTFPGSNPDVRIEPFEPLATTVSYFIGNDPEQWHPAVPVWGGVRYTNLYPGVDLVIGGSNGDWRLDAARGAATDQVDLQIEGADVVGMEGRALQLDADYQPVSIKLPATPFSYQVSEASGTGEPFVLTAHPGQDSSQPTSPDEDPTDVLYGTFLGGESKDDASAIAVGDGECAYVTGTTHSRDFPSTPGAFDPSNNGDDEVFVAKFAPDGDALVYATFLGGWDYDWGGGIAVDETGKATVTGMTVSFDFPTTPGAFDTSHNNPASFDAFVSRLNADGSSLEYSTFLGGNREDDGIAIAVDRLGDTFVVGHTWSSDFPITPAAFSPVHNGSVDVFLTKLNPSGSALEYSTYLGGNGVDFSNAVAVDAAGSAYVTGQTYSNDFPVTPDAFDTSFGCCSTDAFVTKLNTTGSALEYSTFLGGSQSDAGGGIAVDDQFSAYVTGGTRSADFPTTEGSFDQVFNGTDDGFVVKLNASGNDLDYGTFLGGDRIDGGNDVALDATGSAYVVGYTSSLNFPTTPAAFDKSYNNGFDVFVVKLNPTGDTLAYATYLGGNAVDSSRAIAIGDTSRVFVAGETQSHNFPTTPGAYDTSHNRWLDVFVVKMDLSPYASIVVAPIEQPAAGSVTGGLVTVSGFAIDRASPVGTGIDRVSIYLDGPYGVGAFIGVATYGLVRPDVAAQYGARFAPSGWSLTWNTQSVLPGEHQLVMYAHRTTDDSWTTPRFQPVTVRSSHWDWLPLIRRQR